MTPLAEIRAAVKAAFGIDPCRDPGSVSLPPDEKTRRARLAFFALAKRLTGSSEATIARAACVSAYDVRNSALAITFKLCDDPDFFWDVITIEAALAARFGQPARAAISNPVRPAAHPEGVSYVRISPQNPRRQSPRSANGF